MRLLRLELCRKLLILGALACADQPDSQDAARSAEARRLLQRGTLFLQQDRPARALAELTQAVALDSASSTAHFQKGLAHARLDQSAAAIAAFERALALAPDDSTELAEVQPRAHFALAAVLRDQHRYLEAATHLERAIALAPERAKYHFYLGEVRRATGDFAGALTAFKRTIELAPDDSTTRLSVSAELNVEASPKSELAKVHLEARYYHSDLLVRNQQLSQARTGFADLLARDPDHVQGGLGLGGLLIRLGEPTAAIPVLEHVAATDPHNPAPHYLLAQAYAESDRPADARNAQGRFQQLSAAERHLNQGNIYIRQRAWDKAIDSLKRALASDSTSVEIRLRLATVYAQQKRFADARAALEQILARNPDGSTELAEVHRDAYVMLGDLYLHEGRSKEADEYFVRALAIDPDSFAGAYGLGRARFKSGDFAGAVAALRQALARNPDHRDAHYALGLTYVRQANYRDAHTHFARSIALDPDHAESHYGLALILMQQGQREQARQALQKVLALAPDHQRARAKLSELGQGP